jgi:hypothetical protein
VVAVPGPKVNLIATTRRRAEDENKEGAGLDYLAAGWELRKFTYPCS